MVSLYDTFAMFPSAHHHHHHHPAMAVPPSPGHPILARHNHPSAAQLNLHQHHQAMNPQAAYFGYTAHPHHYGQGAAQYGTNMMGNVDFHQQQFGSLVGGPDASTWYPGLAGVSPRTSGAVGYEDWTNSPNNALTSAHNPASSTGSTNAPGGVSSPDSSPFQQHGSASPVDVPYPAAAYGKLLVASGGSEFVAPHHHLQLQSGQDIVSITPIPQSRMRSCQNLVNGSNGQGAGAGHHTPDSGLAGSDGLSSAGSPGQQQQQTQQQQQQILAAANSNLMNMTSNNSNLADHVAATGNLHHPGGMNSLAAAAGLARPQPNRSPFEWMKKPSYQNTVNPIRVTGANWITEEGGKTRTKDKYRVVYTDHQRLELEKEFHYSRYITIRRKSELAGLLGLSERQVKIWFQNRRAKERKQVKKREELLHKDKIDGVVTGHPHGIHGHHPVTAPMTSVNLAAHQHLAQQQMDTKPVLGLE